jgi:hypothetical protein
MDTTFPAQDLSEAALGGPMRVKDGRFVDAYGRTLCLRGFNVAGASKMPTEPNGFTHLWDSDSFYQHRTVDFTGRPFPLEDAPLHFRRLQAWGMSLIRLLVTWESLAHSGPNPKTDLDVGYIAYLRQLVEMMPRYGLKCFICAHQDVWSRFCGGSGAPGWTLEAVGLDMEAFADTGAAYIHGQDEARRARGPPNEREPSGPFVWPSGNQKLAASTMATLFWAGEALAPQLKCLRSALDGKGEAEEVSIQRFLQDALIEAFGRLADELGPLEACLGFEPMNEPDRGLINLGDFNGWNYNTDLHIGFFPSLIQSLALGSGYPQRVPYYVKSWPWPTRQSHQALLDPKGRSAWLTADRTSPVIDRPRGMGKCVWHTHGVWDWDEQKKQPIVLQGDYFDHDHRAGREAHRIDWYRDCYAPFVLKFTERVSARFQTHLSFVEPLPNQFMPPWEAEDRNVLQKRHQASTAIDLDRPRNFVYAPHFYDLNVLFSKVHSSMSVNVQGLARGMFILRALYFGAAGLRRNYTAQLRNIVQHAYAFLGQVPIVIGEVGIPFDVNGRTAFTTGDYDSQRELMHALISAMEENLVGFTLWNYNPTNTADYGDGWNKEDFSIVTSGNTVADYRNEQHENDELYRGARTLDVVIRPYACKVAGIPTRSRWDPRTLMFEFEWQSGPDRPMTEISRVTEVFLPSYHYATHKLQIKVSDGEWSVDTGKQSLYVIHEPDRVEHKLVLQIQDLQEHLLQRVEGRRRAFPRGLPISMAPPVVEAWIESVSFDHVFWAASLITALVATYASFLL